MTMTCGEATVRLLERYGVDTVMGIPRRSRFAHHDPLRVVHSRLFFRMVPTTRCTTKIV